MDAKDILIVSATRLSEADFTSSLLGQSLQQLAFDSKISSRIFPNNTEGLGAIYNQFLTAENSDRILLFVHDDVFINDPFLRYRLNEAIGQFDVVGLAGNTKPDFNQPSWLLKWKEDGTPDEWQDEKYRSGAVAHTDGVQTGWTVYGEMPAACELLDGLFLAVNTEKILEAKAEFDPQFEFHFYDLDFCRVCRQKGLLLGTWPIAVVHRSGGGFGKPDWDEARKLYQRKWPPTNRS